MEASGLFGSKERFRFKMPTQYGKQIIVIGSEGSSLVMKLAGPN
jgi:hypothetical protein